MSKSTIGVLAVQGAFIEHEKMLRSLGAECRELRCREDIDHLDGIVLPGGESTVQARLLTELSMMAPLKNLIEGGVPVLATCAGLILLAEHIGGGEAPHIATLPVTVRRNAYGRQSASFCCRASFGTMADVPMMFIRAPFIESVGDGVEIMAHDSSDAQNITAVKYKNQLAMAFHPELTNDTRVHEYFLKLISRRRG